VESDKFPKAEFKGTVTNNSQIDYSKQGTYTAKVNGKLTIHGVTKDINTTGTIKVDSDKINATSAFNILLSDYKIKIPGIVKDKVSNNIRITIDTELEPLKE
jgi:polyisoprenoid-binding protein YceI